MVEEQRIYDREWHLDKKVPVALMAVLLTQTVGIVWWAAGITARVDQLEHVAVSTAPQAERIIRLETKVDDIKDRVTEIKGLVTAPPAPAILPRR